MASLLLASCMPEGAPIDDTSTEYRSENFKFSVELPNMLDVCPAMSGDNVHGYFALIALPVEDCTKLVPTGQERAIGIWANFNSGEVTALEDAVMSPCAARIPIQDFLGGDERASHNLTDFQYSMCVNMRESGRPEKSILLAACHHAPAAKSCSDLTNEDILYTFFLRTDLVHQIEDDEMLRNFIISLKINE
jgi:hypothetical protein